MIAFRKVANMADTDKRIQRGRPKTFDRQHVIDVAMFSYWSDGVEQVSLNEICRRAGVAKPGVYREFGGEDGLMEETLVCYSDSVLGQALELIGSDRPFREVFDGLVGFMTDPNRGTPQGCLLVKMHLSRSRLGPQTRARMDALRQRSLEAYANWFDRAKTRGEVRSSVPASVAAAFLDTQFTTLLMQMSLGEDPDSLRAQCRLVLSGLTAQAP